MEALAAVRKNKLTALAEAQRLLTEAKDGEFALRHLVVLAVAALRAPRRRICYAELRLTRNRCHPEGSGLPTTSIRTARRPPSRARSWRLTRSTVLRCWPMMATPQP